MPIYEYQCEECGVFEQIQKITEDAFKICPKCSGKSIKRLVSQTSFHLKGSGWYKTDYGSSGSGSGASSSSKGTAAVKSKDSSDSKKNDSQTKSDSKVESVAKTDPVKTDSGGGKDS